MPFEMPDFPIFQLLPDVDKPLLRYMSLDKFRSLVENSALHFAKASDFEDPVEGSHGLLNQQISSKSGIENQASKTTLREQMQLIMKQIVHVSCWTLNSDESLKMWAEYLKGEQGVAVRTTWKDLANSLGGEIPIFGGMVQYINHELISIAEQHCLAPYTYKSEVFEFEAELRLMTPWIGYSQTNTSPSSTTGEDSLEIPVDLNVLISQVILCPDANEQLHLEIKDLLSRADLNIETSQSVFADSL